MPNLRSPVLGLAFACAVTFNLSAGGAVWAQSVTLHTAAEVDNEPKWVIAPAGGLCPEILQALEKTDPDLHFKVQDRAIPQTHLLAYVASGSLDVACGMSKRSERDKDFQIPEVALFEEQLVAAVRADDALDIKALSDLMSLPDSDSILVNQGARVVNLLAAIGVTKVDQGAQLPQENLKKLSVGRGRVYLYRSMGMNWEIRRAGLEHKLRIIPAPLLTSPHYLLMSNRLSATTVNRINTALAKLKATGTLARIARKWSYIGN